MFSQLTTASLVMPEIPQLGVSYGSTEKTAQDSERAAEETYLKAEELRLLVLVDALRAALE